MKSILTDYEDICAICGSKKECCHHLVFGASLRKLADEDGLTLPLCNKCHNFALHQTEQIHENPMAETLSKIAGQLAWEENDIAEELADLKNRLNEFAGIPDRETTESIRETARKRFMARYGRNYI